MLCSLGFGFNVRDVTGGLRSCKAYKTCSVVAALSILICTNPNTSLSKSWTKKGYAQAVILVLHE